MKINQAGIDLIKSFEQCRLSAYKDSKGIPTIGWGATYYRDGKRVKMGDNISQIEADTLFDWHLNEFSNDVKLVLKKSLNDNQFSALISFAYNCGTANLEKSTLLKKVNVNPEDITIRAEFMKWNKSGGKLLNGLTRRRKAEADLYFFKD